jgi:predicted DNA-binding WGR domain protein
MLFEIHRGQKPVRHLPKGSNIMGLSPGPDGSIVFWLGDNKVKDQGGIYIPGRPDVVRFQKGFFPPGHIGTIQTIPATRELLMVSKMAAWTVPADPLMQATPSEKKAEPAPAAPTASPGKGGRRRFEFVEGSSSKFWEILRTGTDVEVRFGRIGTQGQTKTKSFKDEAAARKEEESLIREKTGKGYQEKTI